MKNDAMQRPAGFQVRTRSTASHFFGDRSGPRWNASLPLVFCAALLAVWLPARGQAQVNTGSTGSDGAFNPTTNIVINMADHPTGIYQYTSVNISNGVTVTFIPNANNAPVTWLVQGDCTVAGTVSVSGADTSGAVAGGQGGPGGWRAGNAALSSTSLPGPGVGPGGGSVGTDTSFYGGNASFGTVGGWNTNNVQNSGWQYEYPQFPPGPVYGSVFEVPLVGGSGGSGGRDFGGGGGGGAILIAASGTVTVSGSILAKGGSGGYWYYVPGYGSYCCGTAGAGSGGAIRLVATGICGSGTLDTSGGQAYYGEYSTGYSSVNYFDNAGSGRIRLDGLSITFNGPTTGVITTGFQPIIVPLSNQIASLSVSSIGAVAVSANPSGILVTPDAIISGQQPNPMPIVVQCSNLPLNTPITVTVKPANGSSISAVGYNNTGTLASSTATILLNMPRGGGIIYATTAMGN